MHPESPPPPSPFESPPSSNGTLGSPELPGVPVEPELPGAPEEPELPGVPPEPDAPDEDAPQPAIGACVQPDVAEHASVVQGSPSSQLPHPVHEVAPGVGAYVPAAHSVQAVSAVVVHAADA